MSNTTLFKKVLRSTYPLTTRRLEAEDHLFFNWGYEEDPPLGIPLEESDESNRLWIQLYHVMATQVDISGKDVLEVSCGHGGGASYNTRTFHPASYTGLDFNARGIAFCQKRHNDVPNLRFVHGDAENLPFPDESFDVLINLEASHVYLNLERFLNEVVRVLRPGGHFVYADFRWTENIPEWEAALEAMPLRRVSGPRSINAEVVRAMRRNSAHSVELIKRYWPTFLHGTAREWSGVEGSQTFRDLENGNCSYRLYLFAKD